MARNSIWYWIGGSILAFALFTRATFKGGIYNLSEPTNVLDALNNLYQVLIQSDDPNTGNTLSPLQVQLMLSQALVESGLFTQNPNWTMVNGNNFSGIIAHGNYPANSNGLYAAYPDIQTFVNDWLRILNKGTKPIEASNTNEYNAGLQSFGYYTGNAVDYNNNLSYYYNLLNPVINS